MSFNDDISEQTMSEEAAVISMSEPASMTADEPVEEPDDAGLGDLFNSIDTDGDGSISLHEFVAAQTGFDLEEAEQIFRQLDRDNDGAVSRSEFVTCFKLYLAGGDASESDRHDDADADDGDESSTSVAPTPRVFGTTGTYDDGGDDGAGKGGDIGKGGGRAAAAAMAAAAAGGNNTSNRDAATVASAAAATAAAAGGGGGGGGGGVDDDGKAELLARINEVGASDAESLTGSIDEELKEHREAERSRFLDRIQELEAHVARLEEENKASHEAVLEKTRTLHQYASDAERDLSAEKRHEEELEQVIAKHNEEVEHLQDLLDVARSTDEQASSSSSLRTISGHHLHGAAAAAEIKRLQESSAASAEMIAALKAEVQRLNEEMAETENSLAAEREKNKELQQSLAGAAAAAAAAAAGQGGEDDAVVNSTVAASTTASASASNAADASAKEEAEEEASTAANDAAATEAAAEAAKIAAEAAADVQRLNEELAELQKQYVIERHKAEAAAASAAGLATAAPASDMTAAATAEAEAAGVEVRRLGEEVAALKRRLANERQQSEEAAARAAELSAAAPLASGVAAEAAASAATAATAAAAGAELIESLEADVQRLEEEAAVFEGKLSLERSRTAKARAECAALQEEVARLSVDHDRQQRAEHEAVNAARAAREADAKRAKAQGMVDKLQRENDIFKTIAGAADAVEADNASLRLELSKARVQVETLQNQKQQLEGRKNAPFAAEAKEQATIWHGAANGNGNGTGNGTGSGSGSGDGDPGVEDADDGREIVIRDEAEEKAVEVATLKLKAKASSSSSASSASVVAPPDEFWLRCCVRVHHNDPGQATKRYEAYQRWRQELGIVDAVSADLADLLRAGFYRFTGAHDLDGRPIINIRVRLQQPKRHSSRSMIQALHAVLEHVLRTDEAAHRYGVCLLIDASRSEFSNVDSKLQKEMDRAFFGHFPLRLGRVLVYQLPLVMRVVFPIVRAGWKARFVERIRGPLRSKEDLLAHVDISQLEPEYGGSLQFNQERWIEDLVDMAREEDDDEDAGGMGGSHAHDHLSDASSEFWRHHAEMHGGRFSGSGGDGHGKEEGGGDELLDDDMESSIADTESEVGRSPRRNETEGAAE